MRKYAYAFLLAAFAVTGPAQVVCGAEKGAKKIDKDSYITEIQIVARGNNKWQESLPKKGEWHIVKNDKDQPQDMNSGAGGKFIYIFYRTSTKGNGITGLCCVTGEKAKAPSDWVALPEDLNQGAGGKFIYLCHASASSGGFITRIMAIQGDDAFDRFPESAVVLRQDLIQDTRKKAPPIYLAYFYR